MPDRLPPLTALRAFEAAARHMSFAKAAAELNVTPAALSFQIKSLEEHLGQPVFRRLNRAVELTETGRALQPGVQDGFTALAAAWQAARRSSDGKVLSVTAGPAFTAKWLASRMFDFTQAHPGIELRLLASLRLTDLRREDVDVAIRFGLTPPEDVFSEPLLNDWFTPMMTPDIAAQIHNPADLLKFPLGHQEDTRLFEPLLQWPVWMRAAGLEPDALPGPRFSQTDHAIDAAIAGACIVLGRISLTAPALKAGLLAAPLDITIATKSQYRILCAPGTETRPHVRAFRDWLRGEVAVVETFSGGRRILDPDSL